MQQCHHSACHMVNIYYVVVTVVVVINDRARTPKENATRSQKNRALLLVLEVTNQDTS